MSTPENAGTQNVELPRPECDALKPKPEDWQDRVSAYNEQESEKVEAIYSYNPRFDHYIGIGYMAIDEIITLVKFEYGKDSVFDREEITLRESVVWVERMNWAAREFSECLDPHDEGFMHWLRDIGNEL